MKYQEMDYIKPCNFLIIVDCIYILNNAEEDIRMPKHALQIKVCCYLL